MASSKSSRKAKPSSGTAKSGPKKASARSPLLRSGMESLEHGLFHYTRSELSLDMRFAILHIDQAIELFLKERVRIGGVSIYKNPKETLSMWGAYEALDKLGVKIPEKPDLEMLHEERNNIQHKYANPNPEDASFFVEKALPFVQRFLRDELKSDALNELPTEYLELFGT